METHLNFDLKILFVDIFPTEVYMDVYISLDSMVIVKYQRQCKILAVVWQVDYYNKSV